MSPRRSDEHHDEYRALNRGLAYAKRVGDRVALHLLTNFVAWILQDIRYDDGSGEDHRRYKMKARIGKQTVRFEIPAESLASLNWVPEFLGAQAIVYPGGLRSHVGVAIQSVSKNVKHRTVYAHVGWRKIDRTVVYLHGDGAIGADGAVEGVEVVLSGTLVGYRLPAPPIGNEAVQAVAASLRMIEVAPDSVVFSLYCAIWQAPLGGSDYTVWLSGATGVGKSELAALVQQHYGATMDARHLPGSFFSTANSLEAQAFVAKDAVFVVDDFAPGGSSYDVQRAHREVDRLLRGQGNAAGRGRMRPDGSLRTTRYSRGLVIGTGEDVPRGQSLRARLLVVEVGPGDVDWQLLTGCQADAHGGRYAEALAGYLAWIANDYEGVQERIARLVASRRARAATSASHRRTPDIAAKLYAGIYNFMAYAVEIGAVDRAESKAVLSRAWVALGEAAAAQQRHQASAEPTERFLQLVTAALSSGRAHVASSRGRTPSDHASAWGWRCTYQDHITGRADYAEQGQRIGWIDGDDLYLEPNASFAAAQEIGRQTGDAVVITAQTLRRRLKERGLLASTDEARQRNTVRRRLQGRERLVLHLHASALRPAADDDDASS